MQPSEIRKIEPELGKAAMSPQPSLSGNLRWIIALLVGIPLVVLITGAFYSLSGIYGGNYGAAFILAAVHGVLLWGIFRLGGGKRISLGALCLLLAATSFGPPVVGHGIGYGNLQSLAYRQVQEDTTGRYPAGWKHLDRETLFSRWVGFVTGRQGGGLAGYLRAQAAIGWRDRERIQKSTTQVERSGLKVWIAWIWHLVFFLLAGATAYFAAMRHAPAASAAVHEARMVQPAIIEAGMTAASSQSVPRAGPEDLPAAASWSDYEDQNRIKVSYRYEPRSAFPSLFEFLAAGLREEVAAAGLRFIDVDVRNYLKRECALKVISRAELTRFISGHSGPTRRAQVPRVPQNLESALCCRDEPFSKLVVWETARGYWQMSWTMH